MADRPFRVVMTLMVKNERDIVAAMIEHHLAQGIEHIIVTDNGSDDGTRAVLADYAASAPVTVLDEARDDFPQAEVVTGMARRAYFEHGATWVLNSDADEFWVAENETLTIAEALATAPAELGSFNVPVANMLGRPLLEGGALATHVWRDRRSEGALRGVGLHAHPTHNLAHIGAGDVDVSAGNHFSSLPVADDAVVPATARLRTYHFPWRTWEGFHRRTVAMGTAHERSGRQPSPRHHIMRDLRWERAGVLEPFFAARHPDLSASGEYAGEGFERDDRIARIMGDQASRAVLPQRLAEALVEAQPYPPERERA
ncbi:MAG: glycosyltransferase family 2 protein, partial [Pseudoclavibacter sp.]